MRIGFIGLGTMGGSIALNVLKAGYELTVFDLRREAANPHIAGGASWASSIRELGANSDVVLSSLPGPPEMEAVANELYESMRPGVYGSISARTHPQWLGRLPHIFLLKKLLYWTPL